MSINSDFIEEIAHLANESLNEGKPLDFESAYMVRDHDGEMRVVTTPREPGATPLYKDQSMQVIDAQSFIAYLDKHGDGPETEIRVHEDAATINATLDAGSKLNPGHASHKIALKPRLDDDWKAWTSADGQLMAQEDFADFIEDQALNITSPDAATMLEIATSMQVNTSVEFEQGHRQQDGQVRFAFREASTTKAGANGDIEVPQTIRIGVAPFKGGARYEVEARLRWRIRNKQLAIGVKLVRPELVRDAAFAAIVEQVEAWNTHDSDGNELAQPRHLITRH